MIRTDATTPSAMLTGRMERNMSDADSLFVTESSIGRERPMRFIKIIPMKIRMAKTIPV